MKKFLATWFAVTWSTVAITFTNCGSPDYSKPAEAKVWCQHSQCAVWIYRNGQGSVIIWDNLTPSQAETGAARLNAAMGETPK